MAIKDQRVSPLSEPADFLKQLCGELAEFQQRAAAIEAAQKEFEGLRRELETVLGNKP